MCGVSTGPLGGSYVISRAPADRGDSACISSVFRLGQLLRGKLSSYTITKQIHEFVWLATNQSEQTVVVKGVRGHWRLHNERDVPKSFQTRTPYLRPLIDEIEEPADPPAIVLKYLEDDLYNASKNKRLTLPEIKYVMRRVLEAINVLHEDGYVHTDIKLDNVLVDYGKERFRFTNAELGDCGAWLGLRWGTPTDIWSFGTVIISLIYGLNWHIFKPDVPADHELYAMRILMKMHQHFGPYPLSYRDLADEETLQVLSVIMDSFDTIKPFTLAAEKEISRQDKEFVLKIMKLDPKDRPTAKELLQDGWFQQE